MRAWRFGRTRLIALVGVALCGSTAAGQSPATAPIEWSAERRLSWSDFLGRPDLRTDAAALTAYSLSFSYECSGEFFSYRIASLFQPERSWVKPALLLRPSSEGLRLLLHEQSHFDLSEVHARKFRRAVAAIADPCAQSRAQMEALAAVHVREDLERQRQYDRETVFGLDGRRQGQWDGEIARQLAMLKAHVH
jgi:hypothetical protein